MIDIIRILVLGVAFFVAFFLFGIVFSVLFRIGLLLLVGLGVLYLIKKIGGERV